MNVGGKEIGRVAVLVLDYDPYREDNPGKALTTCYKRLKEEMERKYKSLTPGATDVTVLANEQIVAEHQKDFEAEGVVFLDGWQEGNEYRDLLREGLRQGEVYTIVDFGDKGGFGCWFRPDYAIKKTPITELEILDPSGKIDIRPRPGARFHPIR